MNLICQFCQVKFSSDRRNKKFCCKKCYSLYQSKIKIIPNFLNRKGIKPKSRVKKNCKACGKEYECHTCRKNLSIYCSKECWNHRNPKIEIICAFCKKVFCDYKSNNKKFCSNSCRYKNYKEFYHPSDKHRDNISKALKGKKPKNLNTLHLMARGRKLSESTKEKIRKARFNQKFSFTDIEKIMIEKLKELNIIFIPQFNLDNLYIIDMFIPKYNLAIECDGDYWHSSKEAIQRDIRKNKYIEAKNIKLFRFWGSEIKNNLSSCIDKLLEYISISEKRLKI
jgi:very-short-patch-repair endonuclease